MLIEDWSTTRINIREAELDEGQADKVIAEYGEDCDFISKVYTSSKDAEIDEGERAAISVISTEMVDRDHEVMLMKGVDLKWYRKNPIVMYGHNYSGLPIGRNMWIRKDKGRLLAKTRFASVGANPVAENIYQLCKEGILRTWSVGFIVLESREPKPDEFEDQDVRRVITKWVLLEYSAVPIPSNMEALTTAVGKGLELEDSVSKDLGLLECPDCKIEVHEDMSALPEEGAKPLPNEHSCRLISPGNFSKFRRGTRTSGGKKYSIIFGQPKGGGGWKEQAYRYAKETWSASEAGAHCEKHDGSFEAAKGEEPGDFVIIEVEPKDGWRNYEHITRAEFDRRIASGEELKVHCVPSIVKHIDPKMRFITEEVDDPSDTGTYDERVTDIIKRVEALENPKPVTVRIMEPKPVEPKAPEPLLIHVPEDFAENLGQSVAKGVREGIGQGVEDRLDVKAGRVKELR